jgi:hypothetical protein
MKSSEEHIDSRLLATMNGDLGTSLNLDEGLGGVLLDGHGEGRREGQRGSCGLLHLGLRVNLSTGTIAVSSTVHKVGSVANSCAVLNAIPIADSCTILHG